MKKWNSDVKNNTFEKIARHVLWEKTFILPHPLRINRSLTKIQIRRIISCEEQNILHGLKEISPEFGLMFNNRLLLKTEGMATQCDVIVCDLNWQVSHLYYCIDPGQELGPWEKTSHVFILSKNIILYHEIKIGDHVSPLPII